MSDSATSGDSRADRSAARSTGGTIAKLQTEHGATSIADSVVAKIAALAAREVTAVARLGGAVSGALAGVVRRVRGSEHETTGVGVEVGERQAAVDVTMVVEYPVPIADTADAVRENVIDRIESLTGLEVVEVNVAVTDLAFPGGEDEETASNRVQ